jgi:pentatricopeptide repeat protein
MDYARKGDLRTHEIFPDLLIKSYSLTVLTYTINIMIIGFCLEGLFADAMTLLSKMEDSDCVPFLML